MDQLRLPGDPHGIDEPHDILAADEFAMPSHGDAVHDERRSGASNPLMVLAAAALAAVLLAAILRR